MSFPLIQTLLSIILTMAQSQPKNRQYTPLLYPSAILQVLRSAHIAPMENQVKFSMLLIKSRIGYIPAVDIKAPKKKGLMLTWYEGDREKQMHR